MRAAEGIRIDHVVHATGDLDAAVARVERELGLAAAGGGRHEGMGTANRIVPLGGGYLELITVADPGEARGSALGRAVSARLAAAGDGLVGWALGVEDIEAVAARLGTSLLTIRREGMSARLAGLAEAMREPSLPFFVERDPGVADPGADGDAGGIAWLELEGDARRLREWTAGADLPLRVTPGPPAIRAVGIGAGGARWPPRA